MLTHTHTHRVALIDSEIQPTSPSPYPTSCCRPALLLLVHLQAVLGTVMLLRCIDSHFADMEHDPKHSHFTVEACLRSTHGRLGPSSPDAIYPPPLERISSPHLQPRQGYLVVANEFREFRCAELRNHCSSVRGRQGSTVSDRQKDFLLGNPLVSMSTTAVEE